MLSQMRNFTRSWISYLLLFVLTVAFAIWGINDVFSGGGSRNIAQVGSEEITPPQLSRELELTLRQQRAQGNNISQQDAIAQGAHLQLLDGMIARAALFNYAHKVGVSASDQQVADAIRQIPAVTNPVTGTFDETAYNAFLQQLRYTRAEFEADIRGDMTRSMLMEALVSGVRAPSSFGALVVTFQGETRVVSVAEAPASVVGAIPEPNQPQLQAFWEDNQERLRVPEFRALTLVYARPADFVTRVNVPEARLREEFEARREALTQPEKRSYTRISATSQAQANDIAARLGRGEAPAAIAAALGVQATRGENQARTEVPDARISEAVFTQARGVARAVQGSLAPWAVVRVDAITPAQQPTFESLRAQIHDAIARDEAAELMNTAVTAFEDARAEGTAAAEAGRAAGLAVVSIPAVEAAGRSPTGEPVEALAGHEDVLSAAFQTTEGEASDFIPMGEADVIVAVDSVTPARVRPLDEVREDIRQAWIARERATRLRELGEQVVADVQGGQSFADAARARRFTIVVRSQPIDRRAAAQIPARGMAAQIFAAREAAAVSDLRADSGAVLVTAIERINRVNPAEQPQIVEAARSQIQQGLTQSLGTALQDEIVARASVRRNERLLNQTFPRQPGEEDDAQQ